MASIVLISEIKAQEILNYNKTFTDKHSQTTWSSYKEAGPIQHIGDFQLSLPIVLE